MQLAEALNELGVFYSEQREAGAAQEALVRAVELLEAIHGEFSLLIVDASMLLGTIQVGDMKAVLHVCNYTRPAPNSLGCKPHSPPVSSALN